MIFENFQLDIWMSYHVNLVLTILMKIFSNFPKLFKNSLLEGVVGSHAVIKSPTVTS